MSRIGKKPITIPSGVEITIDGGHVAVKGPKGTLELDVPESITVAREGDELIVTRPDDERENRALHGLTRSLVDNMVIGVSEGFSRELEIVGVGYRAARGRPPQARAAGRLLAPGRGRRARGRHVRGPRPDPHHRARVSTSSSSARSPPTSARSASPSPTRARASATSTSVVLRKAGKSAK